MHTLRDLARDYAKGALDRDAYRRNRSALIDGILAGTIHVEAIDFAPPAAEPRTGGDSTGPRKRARPPKSVLDDTDELDVFDITQVVPEPSDRTPPRPARTTASTRSDSVPDSAATAANYALLVVGAVAIVAIIGLVIAVVSRNDGAPATAPAGGTIAPAAETMSEPATPGASGEMPAAEPAISAAATNALLGFLGNRNWSDASMDEFLNTWQSLPQADREAAASSGEMAQMANAIYKKLLELRALAQVTDPATFQQKQNRLFAFAQSLGINDSRLSPELPGNSATSN